MKIKSGETAQVIYFVAVDATDLVTREPGLSSFTVYRSRGGGSATAMTTPTVTEISSANMPGVYKLLLDEDMTITSGKGTEEMLFHITHAGMAPVSRAIVLYQPTNDEVQANVTKWLGTAAATPTVAGVPEVDVTHCSGSAQATIATPADVNAQVLDVLNVDTFAEPGQEAPPATTTLIKKLNYLYKAWRNKSTQTSTDYKLFADDTTTVDQKATVADDGTTFTRGEIATGP